MTGAYDLARPSMLALDLLRRDPHGLANQIAARALRINAEDATKLLALRSALDPEHLDQARENALAVGRSGTLDSIRNFVAIGAPGDVLSSLVYGTAFDAYFAIANLPGARSPLSDGVSVLADGVLALWCRKLIPHEDFVVLLSAARNYIHHHRLVLDEVSYGAHTQRIKDLILTIGRLTRSDFVRLADAQESKAWNAQMEAATVRAIRAKRSEVVAMSQFAAMTVLGARAARVKVPLTVLVLAGHSLTGAVQAILVSDLLASSKLALLLENWA